jgi:hypothetical protein
MNVLKPLDQLGKVKFGLTFVEFLDFTKVKEHLTTRADIHDKE